MKKVVFLDDLLDGEIMMNKYRLYLALILLVFATTFETYASTPTSKEYVDEQVAQLQTEIDAIYNA